MAIIAVAAKHAVTANGVTPVAAKGLEAAQVARAEAEVAQAAQVAQAEVEVAGEEDNK